MDLLNLNLQSPDFGVAAPQVILFGLTMVLLLLDAFLPKSTTTFG